MEDVPRIDALTRTFAATGTRRRALAALGGSLGLLGWHVVEDAAAHNPLKKCKNKSGKQKKACIKKAKKHNAQHAAEPNVASPPPAPVPDPTCAADTP